MNRRVFFCLLLCAASTQTSIAEDVDTCFALWDAASASQISVKGDIVEIQKDYIVVANRVGNDICELEVYPATKMIPEVCRTGGTLRASGVILSHPDYSDLIDATIECS